MKGGTTARQRHCGRSLPQTPTGGGSYYINSRWGQLPHRPCLALASCSASSCERSPRSFLGDARPAKTLAHIPASKRGEVLLNKRLGIAHRCGFTRAEEDSRHSVFRDSFVERGGGSRRAIPSVQQALRASSSGRTHRTRH